MLPPFILSLLPSPSLCLPLHLTEPSQAGPRLLEELVPLQIRQSWVRRRVFPCSSSALPVVAGLWHCQAGLAHVPAAPALPSTCTGHFIQGFLLEPGNRERSVNGRDAIYSLDEERLKY